jgi:hypothetical protein
VHFGSPSIGSIASGEDLILMQKRLLKLLGNWSASLKLREALVSLILNNRIKLCFSRTSISFSTGMTLLGFIWFGKSTTEMGSSLLTLKRVPFGGEIS